MGYSFLNGLKARPEAPQRLKDRFGAKAKLQFEKKVLPAYRDRVAQRAATGQGKNVHEFLYFERNDGSRLTSRGEGRPAVDSTRMLGRTQLMNPSLSQNNRTVRRALGEARQWKRSQQQKLSSPSSSSGNLLSSSERKGPKR